MTKFTCFIDTSSYVNLAQEDAYLGKTLLSLLSDKVTLKYSSHVSKAEISHHTTPYMPSTLKRSSKIYQLAKRRTYKDYETLLFGSPSEPGAKDVGEKHNLIAALDIYRVKKVKGLIYLTDDEKALRGILCGIIDAFPVCRVWSSFDVILYLYMEYKHFTKEQALGAFRDIHSIMSKDDPRTAPEKTQSKIRRFRRYADYLSVVSIIKN